MFLTAISAIAGLGAGLTPAKYALRSDLASPLKGADPRLEGARPNRVRTVLIGVQAAGSIVLLVLAALLTRGMVRATQVDVGFEPRTLALLAGVLAGLALALAVVGIYGVTSFVVGQRTSEIGLRIALGASARDVMRLLLSESLRPVAVGLGVGVFAAMLGSRIFAGALFGISPLDPMAFTAAIGVLLCAATAAVILPTRHAASVDPAVVLRQL